eukprot:352193-Chlamydomonas_euryale.AAC.21
MNQDQQGTCAPECAAPLMARQSATRPSPRTCTLSRRAQLRRAAPCRDGGLQCHVSVIAWARAPRCCPADQRCRLVLALAGAGPTVASRAAQ